MPETISTALPYITAGIFSLALLVFLISSRQFRRSRTNTMWRKRREAGQRGLRFFVLGVVLMLISGVSCLFTAAVTLGPDKKTDKTPTTQTMNTLTPSPETALAPQNPTETSSGAAATEETVAITEDHPAPPTLTPSPVVIVVTTTPAPSPTGSVFPTFTPNVTPLVSSVTPQANARLSITALDDQISDTYTPVDPRTQFASTTTRIYLFVAYNHMAQGSMWRLNLYREGAVVESNSYVWRAEESGETYFFFGNDSGFTPGNYEIRLFIGENTSPTSTKRFTVVEAE
jgi:hypothetical protein